MLFLFAPVCCSTLYVIHRASVGRGEKGFFPIFKRVSCCFPRLRAVRVTQHDQLIRFNNIPTHEREGGGQKNLSIFRK